MVSRHRVRSLSCVDQLTEYQPLHCDISDMLVCVTNVIILTFIIFTKASTLTTNIPRIYTMQVHPLNAIVVTASFQGEADVEHIVKRVIGSRSNLIQM